MNKTPLFTLCLGLFFIGVVSNEVPAQRRRPPNRQPPPTTPALPSAPPLTCTPPEISSNERMTYLVGAAPMNSEERARIKQKWGTLTIPQGETERAKQVRIDCAAFKQREIEVIANTLTLWKKMHPNATAKQIQLRQMQQEQALESVLNYKKIKERTALNQFDWRTQVDVGSVMNQGEGCNTCWAVAAANAAACSIRKNFLFRNSTPNFQADPVTGEMNEIMRRVETPRGEPLPFVQDLLNCMPIKKDEMCNSGWHGNAFDFMVFKKGAPIAYSDGFTSSDGSGKAISYKKEYKPGEKLSCNPSAGFIKADDWDYVNSPPDKLPTVEQLKAALAEHGPIVTPIYYDKCLGNYRSGVFNEKNAGIVNHVVLLIGWDDKKQAWLVKNSWGEEWGEQGFGWIKYGSNNIGVFAAFIDARHKGMGIYQ